MISTNQILHDLQAYIYKEVIQKYPEIKAVAASKALLDTLRLNFNCQLIYIPTSYHANCDKKHQLIWQEFDGTNKNELAIRHNLSVQQIYNITNKIRKSLVRKDQSDLFPLPPEKEKLKPILIIVLEEYLPTELQKIGILEEDSTTLSQKIALKMVKDFPGLSFWISNDNEKKRALLAQTSLF